MADTTAIDRRTWARRLLSEIAERERALETGLRRAEEQLTKTLAAERAEWIAELRSQGDALSRRITSNTRMNLFAALVSAPVIYAMIVPLALLDLSFSVYQAICFRAYGIPLVDRHAYIAMDRHHLEYLDWFEKLNCAYCGYANGVLAFTREIAARTEQFWCPLKHARVVQGAHARYATFLEYGSREFEGGRETLRAALAAEG